MVQQRVAFVAQKIEVQQRRIAGVPMEQWSVNADCVVVNPAIVRVEVKPVKGSLHRKIFDDRVIRFEEAGIADAEWDFPATVVVLWRCDRNGSHIKPTENESSRFPGLITAKREFDLHKFLRSSGECHLPQEGPSQFSQIVQFSFPRCARE